MKNQIAFIKTNKSTGTVFFGSIHRTIAELAIALENCGHVIQEIRVIPAEEIDERLEAGINFVW